MAKPGNDFQCFCSLHSSDQADHWGKDTHGRTLHFLKFRIGWENACITWTVWVARINDHQLTIKADGCTFNQGNFVAYASCIDEVSGFVVVGAIEDNTRLRKQII